MNLVVHRYGIIRFVMLDVWLAMHLKHGVCKFIGSTFLLK